MKKSILLLFMISAALHGYTAWAAQTVTRHMQIPAGWDESDIYPNYEMTPGAANPEITDDTKQDTICKSGYTAGIRDVTPAMKKQVFRAYGFKDGTYNPGDYEIDHFISLELGGLNQRAGGTVTSNLWPEPYKTKHGEPTARQKDVVETTLHRKVCHGDLAVKEAQRIITTDWYSYYLQLQGDKVTKHHRKASRP